MAGRAVGRYLRRVTHADLRRRLRAYADGTLGEADAEVVRIHLASGCPECLREVFTRPVGLPRPPVVVRRPQRGLVAAVALGAAAVGLVVGLLAGRRPEARPVPHPETGELAREVARLRAEREQADATARARIDRLEARIREAEQAKPPPQPTASPPDPTVSPAPEPSAAPPSPTTVPTETTLPQATRVDEDGVPAWLAELLASDGARMVPLGAAEGATDARGFAVWARTRGLVVVSASNLPAGGREAVYRVRVTLSDQSTAWVGDATVLGRQRLLMTVAVPDAAGRRVVGVDLFRDPPGTPLLTAQLGQ
jgi:hypothetical protein